MEISNDIHLVIISLISFFSITTLLLMISVGIHKRYIEHRNKLNGKLVSTYKNQLWNFFSCQKTIKKPKSLEDTLSLLEAYDLISHHATSYEMKALQHYLHDHSFFTHLEKALKSGSWARRAQALKGFALLSSPRYFDYLLEVVSQEPDSRVYTNGIYACSKSIENPEAFNAYADMLSQKVMVSANFYEGAYRHAIKSLVKATGRIVALKTVRKRLSGHYIIPDQIALINAAGKENLVELHKLMLTQAKHTKSFPLKVAVVRALDHFHICNEFVMNEINSDFLPLKLAAINACRYSTNKQIPSRLEYLLQDHNYYVRRAAARSLIFMGDRGVKHLINIKNCSDPYARDMAEYVLQGIDNDG